MRELRIAVLISGGGRTLANLLRVQQQGELPGRIELVVSNREQIPGNEIARQAGIPLVIVPSRGVPEATFAERVYAALDTYAIDLVLLGGFLRRLPVRPDYRWRIMNIHPSLLPLFGGRGMYGERVHRAVLESGMKVSGCTVHFVTDELDRGPIILQACVPVEEDDTPETLAARVFAEECRLYPEAVRLFAAGRLVVDGQRVRILPAPAGKTTEETG
ncbi:MAG: phosphoribosylglycinamide formyltransferase [Thermomicrobium sp.]|nr:phosphoribosylglycinamide formyltransferase [Thermomicrobium sp.]MDW8005211.1 phosphoribosylglycinamide formyltransferase [Thermomicrobium sp.]